MSEIAAITAGQSPPGRTYNEDGIGLPFFQGKADFGEIHPTARKWCTTPKKVAEAGDILISVRAPVGPTNIAAERCCIGRGLAAIRPDDKVASSDFVHWVLKHRQPKLAAKATGSTFTAVRQQDLRSLLVPLPPLDEQRRIADILNRAARIEALRRRAAERLREFVPALFIEMFGDPVENQMKWTVEPLGAVILNGPQNGLYRPKSEYGAGTLILRIDGFYQGRVNDPSCWQRVRLDRATVRKFALRENDIVINRVNSRPFLGKSAIVPNLEEPAVFESNMMRIGLDSSRIVPEFLISMLQIDSVKRRLCMNAKDAINQASINQTDVRQLLVVVPPLALQHQYAETVDAAGALAHVGTSSTKIASVLTSSLMSRMCGSDRLERGSPP